MIRLEAPQREVFLSPHRLPVLVAGRRFGKTYLANVELLRAASGRGRTAWRTKMDSSYAVSEIMLLNDSPRTARKQLARTATFGSQWSCPEYPAPCGRF